jgi:hypothetical protein
VKAPAGQDLRKVLASGWLLKAIAQNTSSLTCSALWQLLDLVQHLDRHGVVFVYAGSKGNLNDEAA